MSVERSADVFERLADQVDRLSVNRHDPERFFEDRSEIVYRMREETKRLRAGIDERGSLKASKAQGRKLRP